MTQKRVLVKYENLSRELKEVVNEKFPFGVEEDLIKVPKGPKDYFYAFTFDHEDTRYMVKVSEGTVIQEEFSDEDDDDLDTLGELDGLEDAGEDGEDDAEVDDVDEREEEE